jgi:hypothetical protein
LAALTFGTLFFGRYGFLFFFMLGAIQSSNVPYSAMVPIFFQALVLVWFGMIGNIIGERLYDDLREKKEFDALEQKKLWLLGIGIVFVLLVSMLNPLLNDAGIKAADFARKVRNREFTLDNILDFFAPMDGNSLVNANQNNPP